MEDDGAHYVLFSYEPLDNMFLRQYDSFCIHNFEIQCRQEIQLDNRSIYKYNQKLYNYKVI